MTKLWGPRVLMAAGGDPQRVQIVVEQLLAALDGAGTAAGGKAAVAEDPSLSERIDLSHTPNERTANP